MRKVNKINYIIPTLTFCLIGSFIGALSSTIAWYANSTRSSLALNGTSVNQSEQLQVGLVTNLEFPQDLVNSYGITYVTDTTVSPSVRYAFTAPGLGLHSNILNYYLNNSGYASTALYPVTSNEYNTGDTLNLKESPIYQRAKMDLEAEKRKYAVIPFAFRVVKIGADKEQLYVKNQNIWLSDATAESAQEDDVRKAVRCYIEGKDGNFLLNPSDTSLDGGETKVAGLLDLNNSGYFDTVYSEIFDDQKELIYGEYEETTVPAYTRFTEDSDIVDINGSGVSDKLTTYSAKHKADTYGYTTLENFVAKTAKYKTMEQIKPVKSETGVLSGGQILTTTSDDNFAIAKLSMTIYIEGWDYSIINQNLDHLFALGLTFEINKVS